MTLSPFLNHKFSRRTQALKDATISDFSGGLNGADNDITMKTKYSKVLVNFQKQQDGSHAVRWGTKFKWDITGVVTGTLIEIVYFNEHIVAFTTTGQICKITEAGVITKIWDTAIAAALPGAPSGWSSGLTMGSIDTTEFKGELIVQNGVDKPIILSATLDVTYLQDLAMGSNINTPIGKYVTTVANYVVVAGVASALGSIWISSAGTSGVYVGDPAPNDGVSFNLSSFVPQNAGEIIGLASFRNFLLAFFEGAVVVVELGVYTSAAHTPAVQDNIIGHGVINHRTAVVTKNDLFMADLLGWHRANRNQFGLVDTHNVDDLIDTLYQATVGFETDKRSHCYAVWNALEHRIMLFVHTEDDEHVMWVLTYEKESGKGISWTQFSGLHFHCACTTRKGRVFFGQGTKLYQYGNGVFPDEDYHADHIDDFDSLWTTATAYVIDDIVDEAGTVYICLGAHTSGVFADDLALGLWEEYTGEPIEFDWELPWTDINSRALKKQLKYIMADTQGTASFSIDVFVDNYYKDIDGNYDPAVTLNFVAGDSGGYGSGDQPYGGGRRLRDERPWSMPSDFKIMKMRIHGETIKPLRFITLTILYFIGTIRR